MWPFPSGGGMGDALPFFIAFFVDGVVLGYDADEIDREAMSAIAGASGWRQKLRAHWRRIKPAFSVLTLVVSIDNGVDGIGMYQKLDPSPFGGQRWPYYVIFVAVIYLGGVMTLLVRKIPYEGIQGMWCAATPILSLGPRP